MFGDFLARRRAAKAIEQAQDIVSGFRPHPNYDSAYRPQERDYWRHLPGWIWRDQQGAGSFLDVGPGYGTLLLFGHLATGATGHGMDFDPVYMTEGLRSFPGIEFAVGNIELDPIPWPGPFDFIIFSEVLEHLNFQAEPTLRKLAASLAPGGRIYLSTPDAAEWGVTTAYHAAYADLPQPAESLRSHVVDDHIWQFSWPELEGLLASSGLEVVRFAYAPGSARERHFNLTLRVAGEA